METESEAPEWGQARPPAAGSPPTIVTARGHASGSACSPSADSTVEPPTHAAGDTQPAELVVRYRYADGILIEGKTYPHRNEVKKAQPRWRWCGSLRQWGVPRTRERVLSSDQVEECAEGLRVAGVPNVRVDYEEPRPGDVLDGDQVGEVVETLEGRARARAGQLDGAAAWLDRMKPITARHFIRWLPTSYRNATGILDDYHSRYGLELAHPRPLELDHTRGPQVDVEALANGTTATTASAVSEALSTVLRAIEQATSRLPGTPEPEAAETTTGPEDEQDADSIAEERLTDGPADTKEGTAEEHTAGDASAGRKPRGKGAPGSLGTVQREGFALRVPPGEGTRVHAPTGHQSRLFDEHEHDPAVLVRMRAASHGLVAVRRSPSWADMGPRIRGPPTRPRPRCRGHGLD